MVRKLLIGLGLTGALVLSAPLVHAGSDRAKGVRLSGSEACKVARGAARDVGAGLHLTHCFAGQQAGAALIHVGIERAPGAPARKGARNTARSGRTGPLALGGADRGRGNLRVELTPRSAALKISW